ncbi:MAG TPA: TIGR04255 family protein [Arachidicoccus sp.]
MKEKGEFVVSPSFNAIIQASDSNSSNLSLNGHVLKNDSKNHILQIRRGSFAMHRFNGYDRFEDLFSYFMEYWSEFQENTQKLTENKIHIRYLNFIENGEDLTDLLTIKVEHPFECTEIPLVRLNLKFGVDSRVML